MSNYDRFLNSTKIEVLLSESASCTASKEWLIAVSSFFEGAFKPRPDGSIADRVDLTDVSSRTFDQFYEWLLSGRILTRDGLSLSEHEPDRRKCNCGKDTNPDTYGADEDVSDLITLYIMADKYDIPQLRRDVTDELARLEGDSDVKISFYHVAQAAKGLPWNSRCLAVLIDLVACGRKWYNVVQELWEEDIPSDLAKIIIDKVYRLHHGDPWYLHEALSWPCTYHEDSRLRPRSDDNWLELDSAKAS